MGMQYISGDFPQGTEFKFVSGQFLLSFPKSTFLLQGVNLHNKIKKTEIITEENKNIILGETVLDLNDSSVFFVCELKDGRKFVAVSDPQTYRKMLPVEKKKTNYVGEIVALIILTLFLFFYYYFQKNPKQGEKVYDFLYSQAVKVGLIKTDDEPSRSSNSTNQVSKRLLGAHPSGYSLWLGIDDCVYVKDLRQYDLARNGTDLATFKKAVETQTGKNCVLFE